MHTTRLRGRRPVPGALAALAATAAVLALTPGLWSESPQSSALPAYVPGQVLVRFAPGASAPGRAQVRTVAAAAQTEPYQIVPGLERLTLLPGRSVDDAIAVLAHNPNVLYAEPDYIVTATATPNDPSFGSLWGMLSIGAPAAWNTTTGAGAFAVAIIDSGIDATHPDLQGNLWVNPGEVAGNGIDDDGNGYKDDVSGWDFVNNDNNPFDDHGHGTHTAGTVGARGNNGVGVAGVNWNVKLVALKFLNASGSGSTSNAVLALQYAVKKGIRVSNNSWGGGGFSQSLYDAINAAKSVGHIFVAAAGNGGSDGIGDNNDAIPFYPASYTLDNLISVAAITSSDARASFSNYGLTSVDLGAPGSAIYSTLPGGKYASWSGTSMATPHVSGAVAMLMGLHPDWTYGQVRGAIFATARPISALEGRTVTGGTLDLAEAVARWPVTTAPAAPSGLLGTSPSQTQVALTWNDNSGNESGFGIERSLDGSSYGEIARVGHGVTTYTDSDVAAPTLYYYRLYAWNDAGQSLYSNAVAVRAKEGPPPVPTNFAVTASLKLATLTWTDVAGETGYDVGRAAYNSKSRVCGALSVIQKLAADVTRAADVRSTGGSYCYAVRAFSGSGSSAWTSSIKVTIPKR